MHAPMPQSASPIVRSSIFSALLSIFVVLSLAAAPAQGQATDSTLALGSKKFTENVILGWMGTHLIRAEGLTATHREELGGSRFLWEALRRGDIDAYPEYTGTLRQELLADVDIAPGALADTLARYGIAMTAPLGFNNTYALGMRADQAAALGIESIADLQDHPDLRFGFTNEFVDRSDGWPSLRRAYDLPQSARGLDHDIAYRGLANGEIDVIGSRRASGLERRVPTAVVVLRNYHLAVVSLDAVPRGVSVAS